MAYLTLASYSILDPDIPLVYSIIPVFILIAIEVTISYCSVKSRFISKLFDGKPSFIIYKGEINQKELVSSRITLTEVISEIRKAGYSSISEIYYMILEPGGKVSVIPKYSRQPLTPSDTKLDVTECGIDHALVIDGELIPSALPSVNKDMKWIESVLKKEQISDITDIFYLAVNDCGEITFIKKDR